MATDPRRIRTIYLGQFEHERAERIAAALEEAGIPWHYKVPGFLTKIFFMGEWGVRLYVDASQVEAVRAVLERLDASDPGEPSREEPRDAESN